MTNNIADDNTPYKRLVTTAAASIPSAVAGGENLFIDSADNLVKKKNSAGTVAAVGGAASVNSFETIVVSGQSDVVADSSTDTLTLVAGSGMTITTNAGTDTITLAASGASAWTQVVNENGTSFANWTGISGTWSSASSVIKQTDPAASARRAKYNTKVDTSHGVFQADIQIKGTGADRRGGLLVGFDGAGGGGTLIYLNEGGNAAYWEVDGVTAVSNVAATINIDTWYTLKLVFHGSRIAVYLDGVLLGTADVGVSIVNYIGLYSYQSEVWWRNIVKYSLTLP